MAALEYSDVQAHDLQFPSNMNDLKQIMLSGEQSKGVNYYEHGKQVADAFEALLALMEHNKASESFCSPDDGRRWRLPKWLVAHQQWIHQQLAPKAQIYRAYQTWHDCGKPFVRQLDEASRAHYPDHALVSAKAWLAAGGSEEVATLIENDMVCHHLRSVPEIKMLAESDPNILALMITAVCEMHVCQPPMQESSNDSDLAENDAPVCPLDITTQTGFLIKLKRIQYYGKVMLKILQNKTF